MIERFEESAPKYRQEVVKNLAEIALGGSEDTTPVILGARRYGVGGTTVFLPGHNATISAKLPPEVEYPGNVKLRPRKSGRRNPNG